MPSPLAQLLRPPIRLTALILLVGLAAPQPGDPPDAEPPAPVPVAQNGDCRHPWTVPVDAPVVDPFRPPASPYGPGNRGLEYGTEPGQTVVAVDGGLVSFAGPVAGTAVVVVDHGGGLRSSSVRLTRILVEVGQSVAQGQAIGLADGGFHLGARVGSGYVDPAELVERRCLVIRLVPV